MSEHLCEGKDGEFLTQFGFLIYESRSDVCVPLS